VKDINEVRRSLRKIPFALEGNVSPHPPRYRGEITKALRADLYNLEEGDDIGTSDRDVRDAHGLFQELDKSVMDHGLDALAWYHPFHLSANEWGMYIPTTSLHYGAERWFNPRIRRSKRLSLAFDALLNHEVIHHACEYAVAQLELLLRVPCWAPARERLKNAGMGWFNDEEALANANSVRQLALTESHTIVDRFCQSLRDSPQGYRDFPLALSDEGFQDHILEVLRHNVGIPAIDLETGFLDPALDILAVFPELGDAQASCPLYLIDDGRQFALPRLSPRLITSIPRIVETNRFKNMLRRLDGRQQEEWKKAKAALAEAVPSPPRFKKLRGNLQGLWGLYLAGGFRVHIRPAGGGVWEAIEIGSHTAMGHG
jgi:hypothetical protein